MPYKSLAQEGYFHAHKAKLEKEGVNVDEWDAATKGKKLPKRAKSKLDNKHKTKLSSMDKITYLKSINDKIDIYFDYAEDDTKPKVPITQRAGQVGGGAALLGGGLYAAGKMGSTRLGGQGLGAGGALHDLRYNAGHLAEGGASRLAGNIGQGAKVAGNVAGQGYKYGKDLLKSIVSKIRMSSKVEEIKFDEDYHPHKVERAFLGNPLSTLIHGKRGQRIGGYGEAAAHLKANIAGGAGLGVGLGAGIGAGIGALGGRGKAGAKAGAFIGGLVGGNSGAIAGNLRATYGKTGSKNYRARTYGMSRADKLIELNSKLSDVVEFKIEIKEKNKGKFDATKKKTGESTEELEHSRNPKTRKRAVFAANAAKWNHK